jgi:hypothetical protein
VICAASGVGHDDQRLLPGHHTEGNVQEGAAQQLENVQEGTAAQLVLKMAAALFETDVHDGAPAMFENDFLEGAVAQFESLVLHMERALVVEGQDVLERTDIVASQSM